MIGKVSGGSNAKGILEYCYYEKMNMSEIRSEKLTMKDVRGEVLYVQNLGLSTLKDGRFDIKDIAVQFKAVADQNSKLTKYIWHQSFSFPKDEVPTNSQIETISKEFSDVFGFQNNQLITFKHTDKDHEHFHIVANRIDYNGKTTAKDSDNFKRIGNFCRDMETQLGLTPVPNMFCLQPKKQGDKNISMYNQSSIAQKIKASLGKCIEASKSLDELKANLKSEKIKMYTGRGISFFDQESKAKFKGSDLGREYSLMHIEKQIDPHTKKNSSNLKELNSKKISSLKR